METMVEEKTKLMEECYVAACKMLWLVRCEGNLPGMTADSVVKVAIAIFESVDQKLRA